MLSFFITIIVILEDNKMINKLEKKYSKSLQEKLTDFSNEFEWNDKSYDWSPSSGLLTCEVKATKNNKSKVVVFSALCDEYSQFATDSTMFDVFDLFTCNDDGDEIDWKDVPDRQVYL